MDCSIKTLEATQFKPIFKRIQRDFAFGEYAPYFVLSRQLRQGTQQGFLLTDGGQDVAYAICAEGNKRPYALISLLAVFAEHRAKGYGSLFLRALIDRFGTRSLRGAYVEVEKPDCAKTDAERLIRLRRICFYERAGFFVLRGIDYSIWDVPMYLMALPLAHDSGDMAEMAGEAMYDLYLKLMGKRFIHKMKLNRVDAF